MISGVPSSAFKVQPARLISKFSVLYNSIHSSFAEAIVPAQAISLITTLPVVLTSDIFWPSDVVNLGVGLACGELVETGDINGDTNGNGDTIGNIGDTVGDIFLSPRVSSVSPPCGLLPSNVGRVDNSVSLTSDVPSLTPDVVPTSGVVNKSLPNPNTPHICAQKLGFFCSVLAKYSRRASSASSKNSFSAPAPLITTSLDRRS